MPKILVTAAKGLFQEAGEGTLSGHKKEVRVLDGATTLTAADSGKFLVVGGAAGTIQFPVQAGWNATFVVTGTVNGAVVLSGSDTGAGAAVTASFGIAAGDAAPSGIIENDGTKISFAASNSRDGDLIEINVISSTRWHAKGISTI